MIEGDTYLSNDIIVHKRLDVAKDFLEQFHQFIPIGGVVIDVGACLGDYTKTFADWVGPEGVVYAFEPNPPVFECLVWNMRGIDNVYTYSVGLGDAFVPDASVAWDGNNVGASRLELNSGGTIKIHRLDDFTFPNHLDFLKIDAEGFEPMILDGAAETILKHRPVMLIEVNTWPLGKLGFTAEAVFSRLDQLDYQFPRFDGPYGDILCVPKEKA